MRKFVFALMCCCSFAAAQDAEGEKPQAEPAKERLPVTTVRNGKLTNTAWNLVYEARGLERGIATQDPSLLFVGRAAGGVQIEIRVLEGMKKQDGNAWRAGVVKAWKAAKSKRENVVESTEGTPTVMYTETKLDVFTEEHGFAFYARGYQCFLVHCYVADKTDKSTEKIKGYLGGLKLGEDPGAAFFVLILSERMGKPMDDPMVLLEAGRAYGAGERPNHPMAIKVLSRARKAMKEGTYNELQTFQLYSAGAMSHLVEPVRDLKTAIEWFSMAEEAAKKITDETMRIDSGANSAYNLACAYSLNGDVEKGFEAMHRAFANKLAVDKGHLDTDTDLNNLKKNKELWDKFWKECVEGR
jgi:hypothetical protein